MVEHLTGVDTLSDSHVLAVLDRARALAEGATPCNDPFVLGTAFLTPSMRTRVGFSVAALRLGGSVVGVDGLRIDAAMSASESQDDALRVLSGMVDVLVTRTPTRVSTDNLRCPVVNGGDGVEHPTQALIDLASMRLFAGDISSLRVGLCGDLRMRSAVSLLRLFTRMPPRELSLMAPEGRLGDLPEGLADSRVASPWEVADLDVLLMVGLPPGSGETFLGDTERQPWILTADRIAGLPARAVVLSPMPVIDEIDAMARQDHRVRMFDQSDHAVYVRMAILELMLGR